MNKIVSNEVKECKRIMLRSELMLSFPLLYLHTQPLSSAKLEDLCVTTRALLQSLRSSHQPQDLKDNTLNTTGGHHIQLPQMKLPKFSGVYLEYKNFIGLLETLVHDDDQQSNVEKFNHLFGCLEKEALGTVKAFQVTDSNYTKALAALKRVYDNECLIFFEGVSRLFDLSCID